MKRYESNRARGIRDEAVTTSGGLKDMLAAEAERWYARNIGARMPRERLKADPGWDLVLNGWRIDVKWAEHARDGLHQMPWHLKGSGNYPRLIVAAWKPLRADIYALVIGYDEEERDKYRWANGWVFRSEIEQPRLLARGGQRRSTGKAAPYYQIGFDYLRPIEDLIDLPAKA